MKKFYVINICVLLIMFLTAGMVARPGNYNRIAKDLISTRIETLDGYYSQGEDYSKTKDKLASFETGRLYKADVSALEEFSSTDIDQVADYKVRIVSCSKSNYGIIKGRAKVHWVMRGVDGLRKESQTYYFTAEIKGKKTKLSRFEKM